jgi:hypothetical protein
MKEVAHKLCGFKGMGEEGFELQSNCSGKSPFHPLGDAESAAVLIEVEALVRKWPQLSPATRRAILAVAEIDGGMA